MSGCALLVWVVMVYCSVLSRKDPTNIKWADAGATYVVESTGVFTNIEKASVSLPCSGFDQQTKCISKC